MIDRERTYFAVLLALLIYPGDNLGGAFQPVFTKPLANLTVPLGRDAAFTCHVEHLHGYRVGWVKADTKAIQAIHDHVITHNPRVSVSHGDQSTWSLRIKGVQKEDEGLYMCQINTDPMKSQTGMLSVAVPPDFIPEETSGDVTVPEGWHVKLKCRATGIPPPRVSWRREDQKEIIIREQEKSTSSNEKVKVNRVAEYIGEELYLSKIKRDQMGVYHCIASNGVPPSISKRIIVDVHFPPVIHVPNQLVGAPLGTDVVLECLVEASPQSINFWLNNNGVMIISSGRHDVQVVTKAPTRGHHTAHPNFNFKVKMLLTIRNFTKQDVGTYRCSAKNSNGDFESSIRLYDITSAVKQKPPGDPTYAESSSELEHRQQHLAHPDDSSGGVGDISDALDDNLYGSSAEIERAENNRPLGLDNTVQGHVVGSSQLSTPATGGRSRGKRPNGQQQHSPSSSAAAAVVDVKLAGSTTGTLALLMLALLMLLYRR